MIPSLVKLKHDRVGVEDALKNVSLLSLGDVCHDWMREFETRIESLEENAKEKSVEAKARDMNWGGVDDVRCIS